jgi:hypothetical protein
MPQAKQETVKKELFQMLEGEQQVLMKANELLERSERCFQIYASADYLSELYYNDFSDKLKAQANKISLNVITDDSPKSAYFLGQMKWLASQHGVSAAEDNLPCFMISDNREVLIAFHERTVEGEDAKKKYRTAAIWTNYAALVNTLQILFSKLQ